MKRRFIAAVVAGSLLASFSVWASDDEEFFLEPRTHNGVVYLSGGVGADERDAMQAVQHEYTLWLSFEHEGESVLSSDTEVAIRDAKGRLVLEAEAEGPWLMVKLPAGRYRVTAKQEDQSGSQIVAVGSKGVTRRAIRFQGKEKS
ncbi:MAG: carboxypeptidase regulatory-like domain-containing protein [Burkholderiales bacterium]